MKTVNILWTGGWDSTFRVVQLSTKNVIIQPYYLKDNRRSEKQELSTIKQVTEDLMKLKSTKCLINEPIFMNVKDIPANDEITKAYKEILKNDFYGSQYDWLARFALIHEDLELSIHEDDTAVIIINKYGKLLECESESKGKYHILNKDKSPENLVKIFGNFHFPLLNITKLEMKAFAEENGFNEIMNKTWFCHSPLNDEPCGICNPCIYTIEEGLAYRFSKKALLRYKVKKATNPIKGSIPYRVINKVLKLI